MTFLQNLMTGSPSPRRHTVRFVAAVTTGLVAAACVTGCAGDKADSKREPSISNPDSVATDSGVDKKDTKESKAESETVPESWGGSDIPVTRTESLPASLPAAAVTLPGDAVVYNAGERGESAWFVVLSAQNQAAAGTLLQQIVAGSGYTAVGEVAGNGSGTYQKPGFSLDAVVLEANGDIPPTVNLEITR